MLTQDRLKELLHYCPDTGIFTHIKARPKVRVGEVAGCVSKSIGYVVLRIDQKFYKAHRLAWLYINGTFPPNDIDHINRIKTDNRIVNLRPATHAENHQNRSMQSNNTSGHIGVHWHKAAQKWQAYIRLNQKLIYLGLFTDLSDAIAARKVAEPQYHQFNHQ